jgi:molybdopterin molybdotransferase
VISIAEARSLILQQAWRGGATRRPLLASLGLVLAEDVISDIDSPPHDKSLVDGFAVRCADVPGPGVELEVTQRVTAGEVPQQALRPGTAAQIMTGAPLPAGAEAVVMVEQTSQVRTGWVRIDVGNITLGQHIMRRGAALTRGRTILTAGRTVRAVDVGLMAEAGCCEVPVVRPPSVAVLATGNELVDARETPQAGMIRNSNGPLLCALASRLKAEVQDLGIAADQPHSLPDAIQLGLQHDVLILSGGVSAGVLDLVPAALEQLGVERVFHKVRLKPGKPLWFGLYERDDRKCLVFGLPGNPVGSLVCFVLFVAPPLRRLAGRAPLIQESRRAELAVGFQHTSDRPTYHPALAQRRHDTLVVTPIAWQGSSDQSAIAQANCLALFPAGVVALNAGEIVEVVILPSEGWAGEWGARE